jgi:hypothetical protein
MCSRLIHCVLLGRVLVCLCFFAHCHLFYFIFYAGGAAAAGALRIVVVLNQNDRTCAFSGVTSFLRLFYFTFYALHSFQLSFHSLLYAGGAAAGVRAHLARVHLLQSRAEHGHTGCKRRPR